MKNTKYISTNFVQKTPTKTINGFSIRSGNFAVNGAMAMPYGVNFTVQSHHATYCELLLFHRMEEEPYAVIPFPEECKIGDVFSMLVFGLNIEEFEYAYRMDGPYDKKKGLLFDKNNILLDPYAKAVTRQSVWGEENKGAYHARVVRDTFDWGDMPQSKKPLSDLIIYELHVRGFRQHESSGVKNRGTFDGLREKIPYLKELGVNAVELLPVFEFDETVDVRYNKAGERLVDYWGYNTVGFFAPNTSYASAMEYNHEGNELKKLIKELHENGIEVLLDVVFNHTAEGNEKGPCFSFKGLDNNIYYMLTPDGNYYNFSGCGNTLNCNHPMVRQMILECLRYWTIKYRVDGFRFDLASILGRSEKGTPMNNPPLLQLLAYDPILTNVKLIAEAWDAGGMYQVGSFPANKRWAEWNGRYRDCLRGFLKGDAWESWTAAWCIGGSGDIYGGLDAHYEGDYAGYDSCVNFITCHDGFTLYDLYSYSKKYNEANGWDNTDGSNDNRSWNCGCEGDTNDPEVNKLRFRMIRNACAVLMCSRGTPMFLAGDEFGNTQFGNNNGYCQDNEVSWLDWTYLEKNRDLFEFFKFMIKFRKNHKVICKKLPDAICGMPPICAHSVNAEEHNLPYEARTIGMSFSGYNEEKGRDEIVYVAVNTYWHNVDVSLPYIKNAGSWYLHVDTYGDKKGRYTYPKGVKVRGNGRYLMRPRSVAVFTFEQMQGLEND